MIAYSLATAFTRRNYFPYYVIYCNEGVDLMFGFLPFALGLGLGATLARPRYYPSSYPYAYAPYPYGWY